MCSLTNVSSQDGEVDRATIEEYVELEKKIAGAETHSPALILQQKKDQLVGRNLIILFSSQLSSGPHGLV